MAKKALVKKPSTSKSLAKLDETGRRKSDDRRSGSVATAVGKERRKVQRRRQIDPTTCERDYSVEEVEFMQALDEYKRRNGRMFPTCSEILEVIRGLGYSKQEARIAASELNAFGYQDRPQIDTNAVNL